MQSVATAWLVLQLTGSATWLGPAIAFQSLSILVLGLYGDCSSTGIRTMVFAAVAFGASVLLVAVAPTLQLTAVPQMRGRVMARWTVAFLGTTRLTRL